MNARTVEKLCAWSGIVALAMFFAGLVIAGFFPPLSPSLSPEALAQHYREHRIGILAGMVLVLISGMFYAPLVGVISAQLHRIPQLTPALIYTQLAAGAAGIIFFIVPAVLFLATAYRAERSPELLHLMNDLSWIMLVIPWPTFFMQNLVIGAAILMDRGETPVFPRWLAYFNFWVAIGFVPGALLPFFTSGLFAWSGLFVFWLAGSVFGAWFLVMLVMLLKAIGKTPTAAREPEVRAPVPSCAVS